MTGNRLQNSRIALKEIMHHSVVFLLVFHAVVLHEPLIGDDLHLDECVLRTVRDIGCCVEMLK